MLFAIFSRFGPPKTMFWPPPKLSPGSANVQQYQSGTNTNDPYVTKISTVLPTDSYTRLSFENQTNSKLFKSKWPDTWTRSHLKLKELIHFTNYLDLVSVSNVETHIL